MKTPPGRESNLLGAKITPTARSTRHAGVEARRRDPIWLLQKGSPESKELDKAGGESDKDQKLGEHTTPNSPRWARAGGLRTAVYSHSLLLVMGTIFVLSWLGQSITGRVAYNAEQLDHQEAVIGWAQYVATPDFWNRTLQNWQSEFLAIGSMAVLAIYRRQRGSPESSPSAPRTPPPAPRTDPALYDLLAALPPLRPAAFFC